MDGTSSGVSTTGSSLTSSQATDTTLITSTSDNFLNSVGTVEGYTKTSVAVVMLTIGYLFY
jgi:hypothetical protein